MAAMINAPVAASLSASRLTIEIADRRLVHDLDLELAPATLACILGRNGSGKTLTLTTIAGLRPVTSGEIRLRGKPFTAMTRRELALRRALLTQTSEDPFPSTVLEAVLVGRHPHLGLWQWESATDLEIARRRLAEVGLADFEDRDLDTLSGGERRRVAIAAVLAQSADVLLLDEPTNHLDPHHQLDAMALFRACADAGSTVLMTLHDPGLAARHADTALLLFGTGEWLYGSVEEVLTAPHLSRLYGTQVRELRWDTGRTFVYA